MAYDRREPVAAGWQAWKLAARGGLRIVRPVRGGAIVDQFACRHMLGLLLQQHHLPARSNSATVSVPVTSSDDDIDLVHEVVGAVTGARVVTVPSSLAAAIGLSVADRTPGEDPLLVCDVGAGVIEASVVVQGAVRTSAGKRWPRGLPRDVGPLVTATDALLRKVVSEFSRRDRAANQPSGVVVVGGGVRVPLFVDGLGDRTGRDVVVPQGPERRVVRGLTRCLNAFSANGR